MHNILRSPSALMPKDFKEIGNALIFTQCISLLLLGLQFLLLSNPYRIYGIFLPYQQQGRAPEPTATIAFANAGASFTPSPVIATTAPFF
jgi:hypothetical protein